MNERHPDQTALEEFLDGDLPQEGSWALQRHVVRCPACERRMIRLLAVRQASRGGPDASHQKRIQETLEMMRATAREGQASITRERQEARELWSELRSRSQEQRRERIASDLRYRSRALCELVIEESRYTVLEDPRRAEEELRLALEIAGQLEAARYGQGAVEALQARAWAWLGNCLRIRSDFRQAEQAFRMAELYLSQSWLDPLDEALILELRGALRRGQRRFEESIRLYDEAISVHREIGEPHLHGRVLVAKGLALQYKGDLEAAAACYRSSLDLLDGREEPRVVVASQSNLIFCLLESGRAQEAVSLIPETRRQMERAGTRSDLLRLRWVEGRAFSALGRTAGAEEAFLEVKQAFLADGLPFDVALASLDLAALYAREGRTADVKRLAGEILPIFRSCEVPQEALASLIVFQKAAEMEQLTLGLVEEVSTVLRRVQPPPPSKARTS